MDWLTSHLMTLPGWSVLVLVFLVPALETCSFPGVLLPGQSTVLFGGVLAHYGRAPLASVALAATLGAVTGPSVGYLVGRAWGPAMSNRLPRRLVRPADVARVEALVRRLSGPTLVAARFLAVLRTLVPTASGAAGVPYRRFLLWNVVGGVVWAVGCTLAGFHIGDAWQRLASYLADAGWALLAAGVLVGAAAAYRRRVRHR